MSPEAVTLLNLRHLPVLLYAEQAALLLNVPPHAMPILAANGVLRPLNQYSRNAPKVYSTDEVLQLRQKRSSLMRIVRAQFDHWQGKKLSRRQNRSGSRTES